MRRRICVVLVFLFSITIGAAGDTITNVWGTLRYGWIDVETFGIRFQGSSQVRQIEQNWSNSTLLITNVACRLGDNVYAWQIRKSEGDETLQIITNVFARGRSYASVSPTPHTEETALYSEFELLIPKTFDSLKIIEQGDSIEIWLCWSRQVLLFSFTVLVPPSPLAVEHGPTTMETDKNCSDTQVSEAEKGSVQTSSSGLAEDQSALETEAGRVNHQLPENVASSLQPVPLSLPEQEPPLETSETCADDEASATDSSNAQSSPSRLAEDQLVLDPNGPFSGGQVMEDRANVQGEVLRDFYVQGEVINYSFAPADSTNGKGNLTVLQVNPGEEPTLVHFDVIPWDQGTRQFTIQLDTGALVPGYYDFIIWVNGEMEPRRHRVEVLSP